MRATATANGVTVKAYAGTTGVLLAMDITEERRAGLLGFAIQRSGGPGRAAEWLVGGLNFPGVKHTPGEAISSKIAPIQKFRWSEYRVYPDNDYRFTVHPVYGTWDRLQLAAGPEVAVRTESVKAGGQAVVFNRAVAASQSFAKRFGAFIEASNAALKAGEPVPSLPPAAQQWLTRGLLDQITGFIARALDASWALDVAIYEYELPVIADAIRAAHDRGVALRVVYHAKPGDPQTHINEQHLQGLPDAIKRGRITSKIFHHKYIVLSRMENGVRQPQAVLCGSTNFTDNGVYRQANVVHVVDGAEVSRQYLELFEQLFSGADVRKTRNYINRSNPYGAPIPLFAGYSPRSGLVDLDAFIQAVQGAQRDVLFCTAFNLYDGVEQALLGQPHDAILRYGLQNTRSRITGVHSDRTADFTATALLSRGLEGWLKESTYGQKGNILVHTKIILVDFTSDEPIVISGSHNFSKSASEGNDENYLILRGNLSVSDTYGCEFLRLYDHYRFRFHLAERRRKGVLAVPLTLATDDTWTDAFFGGNALKTLDRIRFAGGA